MVTERRLPKRIRVNWPVVMLTTKGVIVAETKNISPDGAFIRCKPPLPPKERIRLFIVTPAYRPLEISAEVAWDNRFGSEHDPTPAGMGVRFTNASEDGRRLLRDAIARQYTKKTRQMAEKE
jgi:hypothetical protein